MEAVASVYKSVWQALGTAKHEAASLVGERNKLLGAISSDNANKGNKAPEPTLKNYPQPVRQISEKIADPFASELIESLEIPQERGIRYDSGKYFIGSMDNKQATSPRHVADTTSLNPTNFKPLGKAFNTEGWLQVQSHRTPTEWRKKYVMLYDKLLFIFDEEKLHLRVPKAMLNFDQQWFVVENLNKQSIEFKINDANRNVNFAFRAESTAQKDLWLGFLTTHLEASCGLTMKLFRLCRRLDYWKKFEISHEQMASMVEHGDVLLFKNERTIAALQRFFTNSEYGSYKRLNIDHVGLLVRSHNGQVIVLEASGNTGVECTPWIDFINRRWYTLYAKYLMGYLTQDVLSKIDMQKRH